MVARLWAQGLALSADAAVALAMDPPQPTAALPGTMTAALPGTLTPREQQVITLVTAGRSNLNRSASLRSGY
jgi:DNA-binding NarL/FixJ family response regulator